MRVLAFTLLAWAAIDAPAFVLDRAGVAALGFGVLALALPGRRVRVVVDDLDPATLAEPGIAGELDTLIGDVRERIGATTRQEPASS